MTEKLYSEKELIIKLLEDRIQELNAEIEPHLGKLRPIGLTENIINKLWGLKKL